MLLCQMQFIVVRCSKAKQALPASPMDVDQNREVTPLGVWVEDAQRYLAIGSINGDVCDFVHRLCAGPTCSLVMHAHVQQSVQADLGARKRGIAVCSHLSGRPGVREGHGRRVGLLRCHECLCLIIQRSSHVVLCHNSTT